MSICLTPISKACGSGTAVRAGLLHKHDHALLPDSDSAIHGDGPANATECGAWGPGPGPGTLENVSACVDPNPADGWQVEEAADLAH
jgi:hypothetical protein